MLSFIWNDLLKIPLLNLLIFFTRILGNNLGWGILVFTAFLQLLLTPLRLPQLKSARKMQELKPKLDRIKKDHKNDKTKLATAQMELFRQHGVSPLGGFAPSLVTIVVLIALYRVLLDTLGASAVDLNSRLYFSFLKFSQGAQLSTTFFWLDLTKPDSLYILPVVVGISQWLMARFGSAGLLGQSGGAAEREKTGPEKPEAEDMAASLQKQMQFILPIMSVLIVLRLPSGVALYWTLSVLFGILQQKLIR